MIGYILRHSRSFLRKAIALAIVLSFQAHSEWIPYTVKKGDELGKITQELGFKKWLWGEKGLVKKVYLKNSPPLESPNLILIGQVILLPQSLRDLENPPIQIPLAKEDAISTQEEAVISKNKEVKEKKIFRLKIENLF